MIKIAAMVGTPDLRQETLAVYRGDLEAAFRKLARLGYDGVELMTKDPAKLDGEAIRRWLDETGLELAGLCTGHVYGEDGLGLVGPGPDNCRRAMARLKGMVDFVAEHWGSETGLAGIRGSGEAEPSGKSPNPLISAEPVSKPLVTIGRSRGPGYPNDTARTLDRMVEVSQDLADYALAGGVRLVLEPINVHQAQVIHTTQDGLAMVRRVNRTNFGLMLDVYHMNIEDVDIYDSFREAGDRCWFVHLADNNRRWPGSAHLDFERIVAVLHEIGYAGFVSLEILPWPDPDTAARSSIESLRRFIPRHEA